MSPSNLLLVDTYHIAVCDHFMTVTVESLYVPGCSILPPIFTSSLSTNNCLVCAFSSFLSPCQPYTYILAAGVVPQKENDV